MRAVLRKHEGAVGIVWVFLRFLWGVWHRVCSDSLVFEFAGKIYLEAGPLALEKPAMSMTPKCELIVGQWLGVGSPLWPWAVASLSPCLFPS